MESVLTVSRQLGSRGSYIAAAVADALQLRYLDREILQRVAKMAGYPDDEMIAQLERQERVPGFLERFFEAMHGLTLHPTIASATMREGYTYDEHVAQLMIQEGLSRQAAYQKSLEQAQRYEASTTYAELVRQVIEEYAHMGHVVIVGRGGQVIVGQRPHVFHVRIIAPLEVRIQRLKLRLGADRETIHAKITASDKQRARYLRHYHHVEWDDATLYNMVINTGKTSDSVAISMLTTALTHHGQSLMRHQL